MIISHRPSQHYHRKINYIHTGRGVKSVCIYDAETGEVAGKITPSYLSMILAEVEKVQTESVH